MERWLGLGLVALVVLGGSCSSKETPTHSTLAGSATGSTSSAGGAGGAGGEPDATTSTTTSATTGTGGSAAAPKVTVESPDALDTPEDGPVVVGTSVTVLCLAVASAVPGAKPVDASSVAIEVLGANGMPVGEPAHGTPTGAQNGNEYEATLAWSEEDLPAGRASFRCTASDLSDPPRSGSDTHATFVDYGPTVTVISPLPDSHQARKSPVPFELAIDPALLAGADSGAPVSDVSLEVAGFSFPVQLDAASGHYIASPNGTLDFNDVMLFPSQPTGQIPVVVDATNVRGTKRDTFYSFDLDGAGPIIDVNSPDDGDVVGGEVVLSFKVTDAGVGVDQDTLQVKLNAQTYTFGQPAGAWTEMNGKYTFTFDTKIIPGSTAQLTVNVTARDLVGNEGAGASLVLYLDNYPPIVDLDPGNVREVIKSGAKTYCSDSFDPVGDNAASDLSFVLPFTQFRAIVWDQTNYAPGQQVLFYSFTNRDSVYLYLQPDTAIPLVVDKDGDGRCDDLDVSPGGVALPFQQLSAVTPAGSSWLGADDAQIPVPVEGICEQKGDVNEPQHLCTAHASEMTRVIQHETTGVEPVVYALGSLMGVECTGGGWEISGAGAVEGWNCLAVRATDNIGNIGVSAPLRVCLDDPATAFTPACDNPPTCTDGCVLPPKFGPQLIAKP